MKRSKIVTGIIAGGALIGGAYLLIKKVRSNSRSNNGTTTLGGSSHDGEHLASKIRHKVERTASRNL